MPNHDNTRMTASATTSVHLDFRRIRIRDLTDDHLRHLALQVASLATEASRSSSATDPAPSAEPPFQPAGSPHLD